MLRLCVLLLAATTANALFTCKPQNTIRYSGSPQVIPPLNQDNHYGANIHCAYNFDIPIGYFVHIDFEGKLGDSNGEPDMLRIDVDYGIYDRWVNGLTGKTLEILPTKTAYVSLEGDQNSSGTFRMTVTYKKQVAPKPAKIVQVSDNGYAEVDVSVLNTNNVVTFKTSANTEVALMYSGGSEDEDIAANVWIYDGDSINGQWLGNLNHASATPLMSSNHAITVYYATEQKIDNGMLFANDQKNVYQFSTYDVKYDPTTNYGDDTLYVDYDNKPAALTYYEPNDIPMQLTHIKYHDGAGTVRLFDGVPTENSVPFATITPETRMKLLPMTINKQVVTLTLDSGRADVQMWPDFKKN